MKRTAWIVVVLATALVLALPARAFAFIMRSDDSIVISSPIKDDLYLFGTNIQVSAKVDGDVIAFGQNITISGPVVGDVVAAGENVRVSGPVEDTVRVAGQQVTIEGPVRNDLLAAANTVRVTESVGRDVVLGAQQAVLAGRVGRNVLAGAGDLEIAAPVGGSVRAEVEQLKISSGGSVTGNVVYFSNNEAQIDGTVNGRVDRRPPRTNARREQAVAAQVTLGILSWVRGLIGMLIFAVLAVLGLHGLAERSSNEICCGRTWASLGIGFLVLIGALPVAALVFIIGLFIGGWWIAFVLLGVFWLLMLLGFVVGALALGTWVLGRMGGRPHALPAVLLGVAMLWIVGAIPIVGWLAGFAATLFGMGAIILAIYAGPRAAPSVVGPSYPTMPPTAPPAGPPIMPNEGPQPPYTNRNV